MAKIVLAIIRAVYVVDEELEIRTIAAAITGVYQRATIDDIDP